jgi:wyosine [tRNA(Phe)-imidazoG37] synthetase (radical SAM superfamily)
MNYRYIFGPVRSRRLGLSLGIDLLGDRICSFDCLYCECGPTKQCTAERRPYAPAGEILDELRRWLERERYSLDHITLGGLGEPCLNSDLGRIVAGVRELAPSTPVAVLTNGSLLPLPEVRRELSGCDVVLPSLDTLVPEEFLRLNRPSEPTDPEAVAGSLLEFASGFDGSLSLEILLVRGVNDSDENLERLRDFCGRLRPNRLDIVTMTRPGAHEGARPVSMQTLHRWQASLRGAGSGVREKRDYAPRVRHAGDAVRSLVLGSLKRRPQSVQQLSRSLGADAEIVSRAVQDLLRRNRIVTLDLEGETFYRSMEE